MCPGPPSLGLQVGVLAHPTWGCDQASSQVSREGTRRSPGTAGPSWCPSLPPPASQPLNPHQPPNTVQRRLKTGGLAREDTASNYFKQRQGLSPAQGQRELKHDLRLGAPHAGPGCLAAGCPSRGSPGPWDGGTVTLLRAGTLGFTFPLACWPLIPLGKHKERLKARTQGAAQAWKGRSGTSPFPPDVWHWAVTGAAPSYKTTPAVHTDCTACQGPVQA